MLTFPKNRRWATCEAALIAAGINLRYVDGVPGFNETQAQAVIDACDVLPEYKAERIASIKADGLARIQAIMPAIASFDVLELIRELWLSITPAARSATTIWNSIINIYTAGRNAVSAVNAASTLAAVDAVVVTWP